MAAGFESELVKTMNQPARRSTDRNPKVMNQSARRFTDRNLKVTQHQLPKCLVPESLAGDGDFVRNVKIGTMHAIKFSNPGRGLEGMLDKQIKFICQKMCPQVGRISLHKLNLRQSKKHPSHASELESRITQLLDELTRTREQLTSTESQKRQVEQEVGEAKKQMSILYAKYEDSQRQKVDLAASEEARIRELRELSKERDWAWQSELEVVQNQRSLDSAALNFAMNEIQRLKMHLSKVLESESAHAEQTEIAHLELLELKQEMDRTVSTIENLKIQLRESEKAKAKAEEMARETQHQLEIAKITVETLLSDGSALMESFNSIVSELEKSRAQENLLQEMIEKLQADHRTFRSPIGCDYLKSEVEQLILALETTEVRHQEEQIKNMVLIQSAYELEKQLRNQSILREADLQSALRDTEAAILGLKAKLLEKDAQLQDASYMNERLHSDIREQVSQMKSSLGLKLIQSAAEITELKAKIMEKETELQGISLENELLKLEIKEREEGHKTSDATIAEVELAKAQEEEAVMNLGAATEELEISSTTIARLTEQLDAAQAGKEEMEVELKRLRVQSEQWKKAAEAAMAVLTTGKGGSFGEKLMNSPFSDNLDDESQKSRNNTVLRRMGELWKKTQK